MEPKVLSAQCESAGRFKIKPRHSLDAAVSALQKVQQIEPA